MNTCKNYLIVIIFMMPTSLAADSFLSEKNVKYVGDRIGRHICSAIVHDDTGDLKRLLKQRWALQAYHYRLAINSRVIVGSYTCNGLKLLPFAYDIGAENISKYLNGGKGGTVTVKELISSRN